MKYSVLPIGLMIAGSLACPSTSPSIDRVPRATATANRLAGEAPLTVDFVGEGLGGDMPLLYAWRFGDGETAGTPNATHTFVLPGQYEVALRITDADGDFDEDVLQVEVSAAALELKLGADPLSGKAPLEVQFSVGVAGGVGPYDMEWDFADGARSTLDAPVHTFAAGGQYDVHVTVRDSVRATASGQIKVTVASDAQPAAAINASPLSGIAPLTVAFEGRATGGNPPLAFHWDFGDGGSADRAATSHSYTTPGLFSAELTVLDADGDSDARVVQITVTDNSVPSASITATPSKGLAPLTVAFQSSVTGGDAPLVYAWVFGDGATSSAPHPTHIYATAGTFTAVLSVSDANGDRSSAQITLEAGSNAVPTISATATPSTGRAPLMVAFAATAQGGNPPLSFLWDFADGGSSGLQSPSHTFTKSGTYQATVEVTDVDGDRDSTTVLVNVVANGQPVITASASPVNGPAPLDINFFASAQGGDAPLSWQWNFGDGSPNSTSQSPTHRYGAAGVYQAQVTVQDVDGDADSATLAISVSSNSLPTVRAFADQSQGIAPFKVNFSSSLTGGDAPVSYAWSFGDGGSGTAASLSHTFGAAGTYTVVLTVTDATPDQASDTLTINVASNSIPTVSAVATPPSGASPLTVAFNATASGGDLPLSFQWDFGDGSGATVEDPNHSYALEGVYNASLVVTDANGDAASTTVQIVVQAALPDLSLSGLTLEVQGQVVTYHVTVTNVGNVASPGAWVDFYHDRALAPAVGDFGYLVHVNPLAPAASEVVTKALSVPPGNYQAWAQADANGDITEALETNNVVGPVPYQVFGPMLINEVYYDTPGADVGTFVELSGPPGTSLNGYALVGVNGANGANYVTLDLSGHSVRSDGFFVVAQDGSVDPTQVDMVDPAIDLQNGPDNLLLSWNANVLDALGYGTFGATQTFSGEGSAASSVAGVALGRSFDSLDTNNNSVDFGAMDVPTPGLRNPVTADSCSYAFPISASVTLDHSTAGAVDNYHAQGCGGTLSPKTAEPDVVYAISLSVGQTLTAEVLSAAPSFDTVLYLRSSCTSAASELVCDDDGAVPPLLSKLVYTATTTATVYLVVDGYGIASDDFGSFQLSVSIL